jgi:hypothetical protein
VGAGPETGGRKCGKCGDLISVLDGSSRRRIGMARSRIDGTAEFAEDAEEEQRWL